MTEPLSRIPLSLEEEHTVGSMARWMRFMAVVGICGALVMLLLVILAIGVFSSLRQLPATASDSHLARMQAIVASSGPLPYVLGLAFLLASAVALWQNVVLYRAGDDFRLVATTDTADLDYLAGGLDRLRSFFKIQVIVVAVSVGLAAVTGIVVAAMLIRR